MTTDLSSLAVAEAWISEAIAFLKLHQAWSGVIFGAMAFGESLVVLGIFIPATTLMVACGPLVAAGVLPFTDIMIGGVVGATLGDSISYWIGRWLGPQAETIWPFRDRPEVLAKAKAAFRHWGWLAVIVGRFIGPLRASVPFVAGVMLMRQSLFQFANIASAIAWIPVLLVPGVIVNGILGLLDGGHTGTAIALGLEHFHIELNPWGFPKTWLRDS